MKSYREVEKTTPEDIVYAVVKGAISTVPLVGGTTSELFGLIVKNPAEKRKGDWLQEIDDRLRLLEERKGVQLASLSDNDEFIDAVMKVTPLAMATSQKEKRDAFRNVLSNIAIGSSPSVTKQQLFIRMIDTLTVYHVKVLKLWDSPYAWYEANGKQLPYGGGSIIAIMNKGGLDMEDPSVSSLILSELYREKLLKSELTIHKSMNNNEVGTSQTTPLAKEFLDFISFTE